MLDFRSSDRRRPRNYFSRREQLRLFMLLLPLGLVIILMRELGKPETADRLNRVFAEAPVAEADDREQATSSQNDAKGAMQEREPLISPEPGDANGADEPGREILSTITDNTYFRNAEQEAWFHLWDRVLTAGELRGAMPVTYRQLIEQAHVFRGRAVEVYGTLREITEQRPAPNDLGIESYYRVIIQPDSERRWPMYLYCLELPEGLSVGEVAGPVRARGYFFKNLSYSWEKGLGIAPVILTRTISIGDDADRPVAETGAGGELAASTVTTRPSESDVPADEDAIRELLDVAGWSSERIASLAGGTGLSEAQRSEMLALLYRLRRLELSSFGSAGGDLAAAEVAGEVVRIQGRVTKVTRHALSADEAAQFEFPAYYECEIALEEGGRAQVYAAGVPGAWLKLAELREPARGAVLFVQSLPDADPPLTVVLTDRLEWYPDQAREPIVSAGMVSLARHGFDVGRLDAIVQHHALLGPEREAFFQMLAAVGGMSPEQAIAEASAGLSVYAELFRERLGSTNPQENSLAREVAQRAGEGRYSVAPLFNDANGQVGRLFAFDGVVRRVTRIDVGVTSEGKASDVAQRFGLDHYFELEVYTIDSQNRPLVFCVRDLPVGFPKSGIVDVPVRIGGYFFKSWRYRHAASGDGDNLSGAESTISPLLVGPSLVVLPQQNSAPGGIVTLAGASVVVLSIIGIWGVIWWWKRSDDRFYKARLAKNFTLQAGDTLDGLQVAQGGLPIDSDMPVEGIRADGRELD